MLKERYERVQERIHDAAARAGRTADEITLVAVSKTWPAETLAEAYEVGMRHFGENRTHELSEKRPQLEKLLEDNHHGNIVWHFIGHLQTRQSQEVATHADLFHAVDRLKIAQRLSRQIVEGNRQLPVLVQVNTSGEESKFGFECSNWKSDPQQRVEIETAVATIAALPGLHLQGLMTMAPWGADPSFIRHVFQRTRALNEHLQANLPHSNLSVLSMGMTDDFEIAIEEGATHIRVGRALFGERHP